MALRTIIQEPDDRLRKKSRRVPQLTPHVKALIEDMKETLAQAQGAGLAAPQVGVLRRIFLVDVGEGIEVYINPEVLETRGEQTGEEGCLSCDTRWGIVTRPDFVRMRAIDEHGKVRVVEGEGLKARAMLHEYDHLEGKLFIDIMSEEVFYEED